MIIITKSKLKLNLNFKQKIRCNNFFNNHQLIFFNVRIAIYILNVYKPLISIPISKNLHIHLYSITYITKYAKNSDKLIVNSKSQQTNRDRIVGFTPG